VRCSSCCAGIRPHENALTQWLLIDAAVTHKARLLHGLCLGIVGGSDTLTSGTTLREPTVEGERVQRKLTTILAADVAGYSRLTGVDEEGTIARLQVLRRELIDPAIAEHRGRIVKTTGDGILIEFPSVVDAVRCAVEVQRGMTTRKADVSPERSIEFRVGIHLGDVVVEGDDLLGDGVNVAARLEGLAEPGGVCISEDAYRQARDKVDATFIDLGEQRLKNIARPLRVYRVEMGGERQRSHARPSLALPDKPSIAVLPFQNMSGDPDQEYFADGMVEEIITALSQMRWLFVIARNSSFTYKGRAVDVKQVGRELGVRYVLEGSVRKAASRLRITGQLIEAATGVHLWAGRFDGGLEDVFDLQDRVTASVVGAIAPKLEQAEIERAKRKPTENLDAYDFFLRGMASFYRADEDAVSEALRLFYKAIEIDPEFASAYGMAAWCYIQRKNLGWMSDPRQESAEAARLAQRVLDVGKDNAVALCSGGFALAHMVGDLEAGAALVDRALALDPNLATAWHLSGWLAISLGRPGLAIEHFARAKRLNPLDPLLFGIEAGSAAAHFLAGDYDYASSCAERAIREWPKFRPAMRLAAASHALAGRLAQAQQVMARMREVDPSFRIPDVKDVAPFRGDDLARYIEGLKMRDCQRNEIAGRI
jgi:TolB-like protein